MQQVNLNDQLYLEAQRRATDTGFTSVDDYVANLLSQDLAETENLDHLFTPERMALIDRASAQIANSQSFTSEQAEEELAKRRTEWLRQKQS